MKKEIAFIKIIKLVQRSKAQVGDIIRAKIKLCSRDFTDQNEKIDVNCRIIVKEVNKNKRIIIKSRNCTYNINKNKIVNLKIETNNKKDLEKAITNRVTTYFKNLGKGMSNG